MGDVVAMPANLRTIDVRKNNADYIICAAPMPDVAMSNVLKLALDATQEQGANISSKSKDDENFSEIKNSLGLTGSSESSTTALELAGRTQIVLLARDFLYSNCEARANKWLSNEEFKTSQDKILNQISNMILTDKTKAEAEKAKAKATEAAAKIVLDKKSLSNVSAAIEMAKQEACLAEYDNCNTSAAENSKKLKACKTKFSKCIK